MIEITIAGAGVAGSYLANLLEDNGYEITVYDGNPKRGCYCAWGCFHSLLKEKLDKIGLNVSDYVLCKVDTLVLNNIHIKLRNQICIDKPKMLEDIYSGEKVVKKYLERPFYIEGADLVVNATATPLSNSSIKFIHTRQYKTRLKGVEGKTAYVYINPRYVGYAWVFPLDEEGRFFHLGAGCVNAYPEVLVKMLLNYNNIKMEPSVCDCDRLIKVINPKESVLVIGNVISIGEAAGFVFPVTGEGIIPSIDSAELLAKALESPFDFKIYELEAYTYLIKHGYDKAFKIWRLMRKHPRLAWLLGFRYMIERAKERTMPVLTTGIRLRLVKEILTG